MVLVAKYSLNGNANDSAGAYNGTATNVTWVDGKVNQAGSFNGSNSWVEKTGVNNNVLGIPYGLSNFSWSGLLKINTAPISGQFYSFIFLQIKNSAGNNRSFKRVYYENSGGVYRFWTVVSGAAYTVDYTLTVGRYYHIVFTTNTSGDNLLYIDGILVYTFPNGVDTAYASASELNIFTIGRTKFQLTLGGQYFNGLIDEVEIHNTTLTPAEVKNKYLFYNGFM